MKIWHQRRRAAASWLTILFLMGTVPALATFGSGRTVIANDFSTATLQSATALLGAGSCDGAGTAKATLDWTPSASSFADGYDIYRGLAIGGPYTKIAHVPGGSASGHVDPSLSVSASYFYVIQATAINWTSIDSNERRVDTPGPCP